MKDSRESLIRAAVAYARGSEGPITVAAMERAGHRINHRALYRLFPGGFAELLTAAGLEGRISRVGRLGSGVLMAEFDRVARELGRAPDWAELTRLGKYSSRTYYLRFGRMRDVMAEYERWKEKRVVTVLGEESHMATFSQGHMATSESGAAGASEGAVCPGQTKAGEGNPPPAPSVGEGENAAIASAEEPRSVARGGELVGAPLTVKGMVHAPTSESAVVFLFGVMAAGLGYVVESVGTAFPDCRALRAEAGTGGKWRRVLIEFELKSSNFKWHRHDAAGCDLIVCWEDDWEDCPLEVVELKKEVRRAMAG